jgi:hypothetical protein
MAEQEKLQCIKDMGIDWVADCPSDHGLNDIVKRCVLMVVTHQCPKCWIKALED